MYMDECHRQHDASFISNPMIHLLSTFKRGDKMRLCHCCHCFQFRLFVCLLAGLHKYYQADFPESWGKVRAWVKEDYIKILVSAAYTHHSTTNEWGTFINTDKYQENNFHVSVGFLGSNQNQKTSFYILDFSCIRNYEKTKYFFNSQKKLIFSSKLANITL